jgi:hypothetical protein
MGINKVIYYGEVLVDMSQVTVKPETLSKGETALDASGELITGTFSLDSEISSQDTLIEQIETALAGKATGINLDEELAEQDTLIEQIVAALASKVS